MTGKKENYQSVRRKITVTEAPFPPLKNTSASALIFSNFSSRRSGEEL
jgi:hypothetical protein